MLKAIKKEEPTMMKVMQIKHTTWERLCNHSKYYYEEMADSYDDMIIKLLDFFEGRYDHENHNNNNDYD